jgi:tetratricopeptide (TPR) repeat protein
VVSALLFVVALTAGALQDYQQALADMKAGSFESALDGFENAVRAAPDSIRYGSEYRQAVIHAEAYDRCLAFFEELSTAHPDAANVFLNYGLAYVDKIPSAGSISQLLLANNAIGHFSKSIEVKTTWLGLYTRGRSHLFWPKVFNRAQLGVADLEQAYEMQQAGAGRRRLHVRVFEALGDGYAKTDDFEKARAIWKEGLQEFPGREGLQERLALDDEAVTAYIFDLMDPNKRVDTDLSPMWTDEAE